MSDIAPCIGITNVLELVAILNMHLEQVFHNQSWALCNQDMLFTSCLAGITCSKLIVTLEQDVKYVQS